MMKRAMKKSGARWPKANKRVNAKAAKRYGPKGTRTVKGPYKSKLRR